MLATVVVAALAVVVSAGAIATRARPVGAAGTNCVPVADRITVAVVIDDGRSSPRVYCVAVPSGATGADAIKDRHPRYDASGLLCAIEGYPTSGCGDPAGGGAYSYWSYWWKDGDGWRYASAGPATRRLTADGMVEGWHYITGVDGGAGNAPRLAPTSVTFGAAPPPTEPPATTPPTPEADGTSPSGDTPTPGVAPGPTDGRPGTRSPTSLPDGASPGTTTGGAGESAEGSGAADADTTTTTPPAAGADGAPTSSTSPDDGRPDGSVDVAGQSVTRAEQLAMTSEDDDGPRAGGGILAAGLLAVALVGAVGSVVIRRRRSGR